MLFLAYWPTAMAWPGIVFVVVIVVVVGGVNNFPASSPLKLLHRFLLNLVWSFLG